MFLHAQKWSACHAGIKIGGGREIDPFERHAQRAYGLEKNFQMYLVRRITLKFFEI